MWSWIWQEPKSHKPVGWFANKAKELANIGACNPLNPNNKFFIAWHGVQGVGGSNPLIPTIKAYYFNGLYPSENGISGPLESHFLVFKGSKNPYGFQPNAWILFCFLWLGVGSVILSKMRWRWIILRGFDCGSAYFVWKIVSCHPRSPPASLPAHQSHLLNQLQCPKKTGIPPNLDSPANLGGPWGKVIF